MFFVYEVAQWAGSTQPEHQHNHERQSTGEHAREIVNTEDGAGPVRLQGHNPVEARQPEGHSEYDEEDYREADVAAGMADLGIVVLAARRADDRGCERDPHSDVDERSHQEERPSKPQFLKAVVRRNRSPWISRRMQKKDDRQHHGACRKHHRHGLRNAPESDAPSRAAGILDGYKHDSSEPETGQEVPGHQQGSPSERRLP